MLDLRWVMWSFYFPHGKHILYVQFEGTYQQIVGIPMGTNCSTHSGCFLFCYERDFMSNLHKSKHYDLIDMFNDTSTYLLETYFWYMYISNGIQLNKANAFDKGPSFLDLNIKVIGNDVHTSVHDKHNDFGFPIVNRQFFLVEWLMVFAFLSW